MMNEQIFSKEEAKNPNPQARMKCSRCGVEGELSDFLREEALPDPYPTVKEGFLLCPSCHWRHHIYFMSAPTRMKQFLLQKAVNEWHRRGTNAAFSKMNYERTVYKNSYDRDQQRFSFLLEKGTATDAEQ